MTESPTVSLLLSEGAVPADAVKAQGVPKPLNA